MLRQRSNLYSRIEEIRESRRELSGLVLTTVVLGVLVNLLAAVLYVLLVQGERITRRYVVVLMVIILLSVLLVLAITWLIYGRRGSAEATVELAVPYHLEGVQHIRIASQPAHQPAYSPIGLGALRFAATFDEDGTHCDELRSAWQVAQENRMSLQDFLAPWHKMLVDCLILDVLHSYGQETLSPKARYRSPLPIMSSYAVPSGDLPLPLRENLFVQTLVQRSRNWELTLPVDVQLIVNADRPDERTWTLRHKHYGQMAIQIRRQYQTKLYKHKVGRILGAKLTGPQKRTLRVLISWLTLDASFRWTFWPGADPFHQWTAGLLAHFEKELDWSYYESGLPDRVLMDLSWIVGDLPKGESLWHRLAEISGDLEELRIAVRLQNHPETASVPPQDS